MQTAMTAVEMTGTIDEHQQLHLDGILPITGPKRVRVIVLSPVANKADWVDWDESEWLQAAARNPAFDFLKDAAEDIYTLEDGRPFHDQE
jgi:hypothetical protein